MQQFGADEDKFVSFVAAVASARKAECRLCTSDLPTMSATPRRGRRVRHTARNLRAKFATPNQIFAGVAPKLPDTFGLGLRAREDRRDIAETATMEGVGIRDP